MENIISLRNIVVEFDGDRILKNINLDIKDKEFVTLLGPSGCGKTTTLRIIGGFLTPTSGDVMLDGKRINDLPPHKRDVNTVFQKYALFPHLNVFENVAFGLRLKKMDEETIRRKVRDMLEVVGLKGFERRSIGQMSGGQQQRVAIARSLVNEPEILLLDEPLGALDLKLRKEMQLELKRLQREMNITFIYVTHDQVEAMTLGDRIVIMRDGFIQQIGTPQEVFNHPANLFVAGFIGTPQMNFFDATLSKKGDKYVATVQGKDFELPADKQEALKKMDKVPVDIIAGVRPVHIHLSQDGIDAMVDVSELMGSELHLHVNSNGKDVVIVVPTTDIDLDAVHGSHKPVKYSFKPELMHFFDKETEKNLF